MFATKQTTIVPEIHGAQNANTASLGQVPNLELESGTTGAPGHIVQQDGDKFDLQFARMSLGSSSTFAGTVSSSATFPSGHIVQVQSVVDNSTGSINVANWTLHPNMTLTVTPKFNNSYFFLIGRCSGENSNDEHRLNVSFFRDDNRINPGEDVGSIVGTMFVGYSGYRESNNDSTPVSFSFQTLDKTAGTIAGTSISFQIKLKDQNSNSTTWYYNRTLNSATTAGSYERLSSELIVMEVKQ